MLSMQYLQNIVAIFVAVEIVSRLSIDICKTKEKQKTREGLLKLNRVTPNLVNRMENRFFLKKRILFTDLLDFNFHMILRWIRNLKAKFSIKVYRSIIVTVILIIISTGILLNKSYP